MTEVLNSPLTEKRDLRPKYPDLVTRGQFNLSIERDLSI
jgi:hypothetical protein